MRILLVDGDNNCPLGRTLEAEGFVLNSIPSHAPVQDYLKAFHYGLVIYCMAQAGISDARFVKSLREGEISTPVLVLSGNSDSDCKLKAFGAGADDFIVTPCRDGGNCSAGASLAKEKSAFAAT